MDDGFANTSYGRIHYLTAGTGDPLLLLHSNGCSAYNYEHVVAPLARHRRVIAWDMPGQGDSDSITRHHTVEDYANALVAFMDALGLERASVLGSSIGGSICIALGARHAGRLDRLIPVETPARSPEESKSNWFRTEQSFGIPTQTLDQIKPRFRTATPELLTRWNIDRNKAGGKAMLDAMWALRDYDVVADMSKITTKSLVIFGDRGPNAAKAAFFTDRIPTVRLEIMRDCGHFPMIDDPDGFVAVVEAFLDEAPTDTTRKTSEAVG